jgi:hypothetical protein
VISRKRKIILLQITIFFVASFLLYNTYRNKDEITLEAVMIEPQTDPKTNSFTDIEYSGFDLNGNRYILRAKQATFETETPEKIDMKIVVANFYLKDDTVLNVTSDQGLYNSVTLDMNFKQNVKAVYSTNTLFSDQLTYSNSEGKLLASGNVNGESVEKGKFFADNVEYNLTSKALDFSMLDKKQVNVKLKK